MSLILLVPRIPYYYVAVSRYCHGLNVVEMLLLQTRQSVNPEWQKRNGISQRKKTFKTLLKWLRAVF